MRKRCLLSVYTDVQSSVSQLFHLVGHQRGFVSKFLHFLHFFDHMVASSIPSVRKSAIPISPACSSWKRTLIRAFGRIDHQIYFCRSCSADNLTHQTLSWNHSTFWTFYSCLMENPPTTFVPTMDLGATMHREMIDAATLKDSSTYTGCSGRKRHNFYPSRKTAVLSRYNTYTIKTNVERCLRYISSNVQRDSRLASTVKEQRTHPQPAKSTKIMQNTHFFTKIDTTKTI